MRQVRTAYLASLSALAALGSAAHAQSATVTVFGRMPTPVTSEAGGARTTMASAFALYELGRWSVRAAQSGPGKIDSLLKYSPVLAAASYNDDCGRGFAPPRLLGARADRARRAFWPTIAAAECRWGLPTGLMDSLVLAESRYDPSVVSRAGAAGLAQLMPSTASSFGVTDRFDPAANIEAGAHYLRLLLDGFGGNVPLALAAYNAGPGIVRRNGHIPLNGETPAYVGRVLDYWTAPGIGPMSPTLSAHQTAQMLGF